MAMALSAVFPASARLGIGWTKWHNRCGNLIQVRVIRVCNTLDFVRAGAWTPALGGVVSEPRLPAAVPSDAAAESGLVRRERRALGTVVEIGVFASGVAAEAIVGHAFDAIGDAHARWSFHDPASELSRLNLSPGRWVAVSRSTVRLLRLARALMRASEGAFDCTVGGWLVALGALPDHGTVPALLRGRAADIELQPFAARLLRPVRLTLDGIAKGYAVDLAVRAMQQAGASAGWVDAGGDLRVFGEVALPLYRRAADDRLVPLGTLREGAAATSSAWPAAPRDAQRLPAYLIARPGERRRTGCWTVFARQAWRADGLTKVAAATAEARCAGVVASLGGRLISAAA